ncbi:MAG: hypothetical protein ACE5Z5_07650 [Candidatus Bathyarchaeia archaeon]
MRRRGFIIIVLVCSVAIISLSWLHAYLRYEEERRYREECAPLRVDGLSWIERDGSRDSFNITLTNSWKYHNITVKAVSVYPTHSKRDLLSMNLSETITPGKSRSMIFSHPNFRWEANSTYMIKVILDTGFDYEAAFQT